MLLSIVLLQIKMTRTIEHSNSFYFFWINTDYQTRNTMTFHGNPIPFLQYTVKKKNYSCQCWQTYSSNFHQNHCIMVLPNSEEQEFCNFLFDIINMAGLLQNSNMYKHVITICSGFPNSEEQVLLCSQYLRHIMALEHDCIISL